MKYSAPRLRPKLPAGVTLKQRWMGSEPAEKLASE